MEAIDPALQQVEVLESTQPALFTDPKLLRELLKSSREHRGCYPNEIIKFHHTVNCESLQTKGRLLLTNHRVLFLGTASKCLFECPLSLLARFERNPKSKQAVALMQVKFRPEIFSFRYLKDDYRLCDKMIEAAAKFLKPGQQEFAAYCPSEPWSPLASQKQLMRQEILMANGVPRPGLIMLKQQICPTYPPTVLMPASVTLGMLKVSAQLRQGKRYPVLVYSTRDSDAKRKYVNIYRAGQKTLNIMESMRKDQLLQQILMLEGCSDQKKLLYVQLKQPNRISSKPSEHRLIRLLSFELSPPRVLYDSLSKICLAVDSQCPTKYYELLHASRWLHEISRLLQITEKVVAIMRRDSVSVILQCGDGSQRAAQISALCQVVVDPYFRTIQGFGVLVEKEFVSMGYNFMLRNGILNDNENQAPLFLQFLDCVFQLTRQYPLSFQFTSTFLTDLALQSLLHQSGSFLFRSQKQRVEHHVYQRTRPVWSLLQQNRRAHTNLFFSRSVHDEVIVPHSSLRVMQVWTQMVKRLAFPKSQFQFMRMQKLNQFYRASSAQCEKLYAQMHRD